LVYTFIVCSSDILSDKEADFVFGREVERGFGWFAMVENVLAHQLFDFVSGTSDLFVALALFDHVLRVKQH
jgi:hypothetical protein